MISRQACIICALSTPVNQVINFSISAIFWTKKFLLLNLAHGLEADIASAAATIHQIGEIIGISWWCHSAVLTVTSS